MKKKAALPVILATVIFLASWLAYNAIRPPDNNKTASSPKTASTDNQPANKFTSYKAASKKKATKIYFPSGSFLKAETYKGRLGAKEALVKLIRGPKEKGSENFIPPKTRLLSLKIVNNRAYVNFSKEILRPQNASGEAEELTIYSIVNTLTEHLNIKEVFIQVEGRRDGEVEGYLIEDFWGHIGLYDQPFKRNENLIR